MKQYLVYQLPFEHSLKRDLPILETFQVEELSDEFVVVATVRGETLNDVFRIGNFVCSDDQDSIDFHGKMHSISVGDIIVDVAEDQAYAVAPFGFEKIEMKEEVV